uniref:Teneurin-m n=1 Tax=Culex pipiens TaxID=7175 RepID=A0A8D8CYB6_CULPI
MECRDNGILRGAVKNNTRGCLLDGVPPSAPPDVPPRNPTMSRMNGRVTGNPTELGVDFEPSCLVRTPSGNVYIPSGNLGEHHFHESYYHQPETSKPHERLMSDGSE